MINIKNEAMYIQIAKKIMLDIFNEEIKQGDKLLTVRDYTVKYKVTMRTIQNSFDYLLEQKIIKKSGKKTLVIVNKDFIKELYKQEAKILTNDYLKKLELIGYKQHVLTLLKENGGIDND